MLTDCRNFGYRVSIHKTCENISSREFFAGYESIQLWNTSQIRGKDLILRSLRMKDNGNLVGALRTGAFRLVINLSFKH